MPQYAPEHVELAATLKEIFGPRDEAIAELRKNMQTLMQRSSRPPGASPLEAAAPNPRRSGLSIVSGDGLAANAQFAEFLKSPKTSQTNLALHLRLEAKASPITGGSGVIPVTPVALPRLGPPMPQLRVGDLLPRVMIDAGPGIAYTKETSYAPAADLVPEGTLKPTTSLTFTNVSRDFVTIATITKSSIQAISDLSPLTAWIEQRLNYAVRLKEETYLLSDATGGLLPQASPLDPAYAPGTGATGLDTIAAAISSLESQGFEPDGIVLNGVDIAKMRLLKSSFGTYLWASPDSEIGTASMWSIPVVRSVNMPAGSYLVGSFQLSTILFQRAVMTLQIAFQNEADFVENLCCFRCEERIGLAVLLPSGLITGSLPSGSMQGASATGPQTHNAGTHEHTGHKK